MNDTACTNLPRVPLNGTGYRAIQLLLWNSLLAWRHTRTIPGRFNAGHIKRPGFAALYFAESHLVAPFEVRALLGSPPPTGTAIPNPNGNWAIVNVQIQLNKILDLTEFNGRRLINTTVQELTGIGGDIRSEILSWRSALHTGLMSHAKLGHALQAVEGLPGFVTYSSKVPTNRTLIVFPAKLREGGGSFVRFENPVTGQTQTTPGIGS